MTLAIDISNNQGLVDLRYLPSAGVGLVVAKASEGRSYHDDFYLHNLESAADVGVPFGAYCFGRPSAGSGYLDAENYRRVVQSGPEPCLHVLDLEDDRVPTGASLAAYTMDWFDHVSAWAKKPLYLYTSYGYAEAHGVLKDPGLLAFRLWVASWSITRPSSFGPWAEIDAWQFTDEGFTPGIGRVDQSIWYAPI